MNVEYIIRLVTENPLALVFAMVTTLLLIQNFLLNLRVSRLTRGANGQSLEKAIRTIDAQVQGLEKYAKNSSAKIQQIDARVQTSVRGVSLERFDPFQGSGGQQSFVTAFLNEEGSGIVLSGIHSRDGVRVYAKDVKNFTSERELSDEEQRAIKSAQKTLA